LENKEDKTVFQVPLMIKAKVANDIIYKKLVLTNADKDETIEFDAKPDWVVVNEGGHGFYRVRYSEDLLKALTSNLQYLAPVERFNLVNDTWASVLAGLTPLADYLQVASLFAEETDRNVWAVLVGSMHYLERVVGVPGQKEAPEKLQAFLRKLVLPTHKRLGWEKSGEEDTLTSQLRGMMISALGTIGNDKDVRAKAGEYYEKYRADRSSVSADVAPALVSVLAWSGDEPRYTEFVQDFKDAKTPQEEDRYMYALAAFRNEALLEKTLAKTIDGEIRTQSAPYVVRMLMLNTTGRNVSWSFFKKNWETIIKLFPDNSLTRMCEGVTGLVSEEMLKEAHEFFSKNPLKQGGKLIDQSLEKLAVSVELKKREKTTLQTF
jgi:puromycin-sensitive aminopeptidase